MAGELATVRLNFYKHRVVDTDVTCVLGRDHANEFLFSRESPCSPTQFHFLETKLWQSRPTVAHQQRYPFEVSWRHTGIYVSQYGPKEVEI